jgi:ABC-2 type transport system ATP-binding protein
MELLNAFDLESLRNIKNDELSIGQRRRVQVAREFMHDMDLLFLDEPTVGLDPSARRTLLDYIKRQVKEGLTVFFTTAYHGRSCIFVIKSPSSIRAR